MLPTNLTQVVGLFNIFVGLMLTLSVLLMVAGIVVWAVRLGTSPTYRDEALKMMQWSISILFTLIVLLLASKFIQQNLATAVFILGILIIGALAWVGYKAAQEAAPKEEH